MAVDFKASVSGIQYLFITIILFRRIKLHFLVEYLKGVPVEAPKG